MPQPSPAIDQSHAQTATIDAFASLAAQAGPALVGSEVASEAEQGAAARLAPLGASVAAGMAGPLVLGLRTMADQNGELVRIIAEQSRVIAEQGRNIVELHRYGLDSATKMAVAAIEAQARIATAAQVAGGAAAGKAAEVVSAAQSARMELVAELLNAAEGKAQAQAAAAGWQARAEAGPGAPLDPEIERMKLGLEAAKDLAGLFKGGADPTTIHGLFAAFAGGDPKAKAAAKAAFGKLTKEQQASFGALLAELAMSA